MRDCKPNKNYLDVLNAIVIDRWKDRYALLEKERAARSNGLEYLKVRKSRLLEMRAEGEISKEEFLDMKAKLDNQIAAAQVTAKNPEIETSNLENVLSQSINFLKGIVKFWEKIKDVKQKQRLQRMVLPQGLTYDKITKTFGTAVLSHIFRLSGTFDGGSSCLVAPPGIAPGPPAYETGEVLLLHSAKNSIKKFWRKSKLRK